MSGARAKFSRGAQETGYLALAGKIPHIVKKRVQSPDDATIFINGNEALIQACSELGDGELVVPVPVLNQPSDKETSS